MNHTKSKITDHVIRFLGNLSQWGETTDIPSCAHTVSVGSIKSIMVMHQAILREDLIA